MRKKICRNKLEKSASTKKEKKTAAIKTKKIGLKSPPRENGKNPIGDYRVEKVGQQGRSGTE
jgi:hypothetical protein